MRKENHMDMEFGVDEDDMHSADAADERFKMLGIASARSDHMPLLG